MSIFWYYFLNLNYTYQCIPIVNDSLYDETLNCLYSFDIILNFKQNPIWFNIISVKLFNITLRPNILCCWEYTKNPLVIVDSIFNKIQKSFEAIKNSINIFSTKLISSKLISSKLISSKLISSKLISSKLFSAKLISPKQFSVMQQSRSMVSFQETLVNKASLQTGG